jgi:hypothetical protein
VTAHAEDMVLIPRAELDALRAEIRRLRREAADREALLRIRSDSGEGRTFTREELAEAWESVSDRLADHDSVTGADARELSSAACFPRVLVNILSIAWAAPRRKPRRSVSEHDPAHHAVHVQALAEPRQDAGELVLHPNGGEAVADAEDEGCVVNADGHHVFRSLRAEGLTGAEVKCAVQHEAQRERG